LRKKYLADEFGRGGAAGGAQFGFVAAEGVEGEEDAALGAFRPLPHQIRLHEVGQVAGAPAVPTGTVQVVAGRPVGHAPFERIFKETTHDF